MSDQTPAQTQQTPSQDRPLITFMLIAYNQERYIREAVEGAFAQTYSPLEIILSDDCSTDRTFEIMQEMAARYKGPHKIILNRNEKNLGICGHVNRCVEITHGELIICAAGDDISFPNRSERLVKEWLKPERKWHSVFSNRIVIDSNGQRMYEQGEEKDTELYQLKPEDGHHGLQVRIHGFSHAFSRRTFEIFGPLDSNGIGEDMRIAARSAILGGVLYLNEVLVKYRRHDNNVWLYGEYLKKLNIYKRYCYKVMLRKESINRTREIVKYLEIAIEKDINVSNVLPCLQNVLIYKNERLRNPIIGLLFLVIRKIKGTYRPGMYSMFEDTNQNYAIIYILRYIRRKFKKNA